MKKFIGFFIVISLVLISLTILQILGVNTVAINFIRYVVGFIYLTVLPGTIILRIFRIHSLGAAKALLYSVGLSLVYNMFLGFIVNILYPYLGIVEPLSLVSLMFTWTFVLGILCVVAYKRDRSFDIAPKLNVGSLFSAPFLLCTMAPLLAILGTFLVNMYNNNIILIILLAGISLIPLLLVITRQIPENSYPFVIFVVSISMLFHASLISNYISGFDARLEYYMYQVVASNNSWNSIVPLHPYNSTLSVTILPAIYGLLLNIEGTWIFKVLIPLFFSLLPVALFQLFKRQFDEKVAFLAVFFFMAVAPFFTVLLQLGKQMLAEVFFTLFLLTLMDDRLSPTPKKFLLISFGVGVVVSHYSTAYLFIIVLVACYILLFLFRDRSALKASALIILFVIVTLSWYMYTAGGISFTNITRLVYSIYDGLGELFFDPLSRYSIYVITGERAILHEISKYLYLISQFFIAVGFLDLFIKWVRRRHVPISNEYMGVSAAMFTFMLLSLVLPGLSGATDITRSFHTSLLLLAPFGVYGVEVFGHFARNTLFNLDADLRRTRLPSHFGANYPLVFVGIFLSIFFLFTTGIIYELSNDTSPSSMALSRLKIQTSVYNTQDINAASWMIEDQAIDHIIYFDSMCIPLLGAYFDPHRANITEQLKTVSLVNMEIGTRVPSKSYFFLDDSNIRTGKLILGAASGEVDMRGGARLKVDLSSLVFYSVIQAGNIIYNNGGSRIYQTRSDYP